MTTTWATVIGLIATTAILRASGPVLLGGRDLPAIADRVIALLAPAILAALIAIGTFTTPDGDLVLDARAAGLASAAAVLAYKRDGMLLAVTAAALAAALVRTI